MAQVFVEVCSAQPVDGGSAWEAACGEVLRAWAGLARAGESGRRFVDYWLQQSGAGRAALGLLLDYAESPAEDAGSEWRLARQAHHTWAAVEARLGEVGRGAELARALGEAIAQDVDDVRAKRGPGQLARLASGVYGRICPQSDEATLRALVAMWLLDGARRAGPDEQTARAAAVAGGAGLWQAVEDAAASAGPDASFHSAAHWLAATSAGPEAAPVALDAGGRARAARWAIFGIEFVRRAGGLCVLAGAGQAAVADFVLRMALAFVLLREALLLASSNAEWSAAEAGSGDRRMVAQAAIVSSGSASAEVLAQADRAARAIQDAVSDLLALVAVYDQPLPARGTQSGRLGAGAPPDAGRWLGKLMEHVLGEPSKAAPDSVWDCVVERLVERCRSDAGTPWVLVLGHVAQWCQWAHPLPPVCVEAEAADALSRRLAPNERPLDAATAVAAATVARAVALRHACARAPAMRSALLDAAGRLQAVAGGGDAVVVTAHLELLAELLPAGEAAVEAQAVVAKIAGALDAVRGDSIGEAVAGLAVVQQLAACAAGAVDGGSAARLVRLCVRWSECDAGRLGEAAVLSAVGRAAEELAQRMQTGASPAADSALRQLGARLVEACVLGERPVAAGAQAAAQLAESGFLAAVPELPRLFPVLATAPPPLHAALVRLALAAPDRAAYAAAGPDSLARLALAAAKTLSGLVAAPAD
ncbi:hypothetical protein H4R21_004864, partial [Coemansia helicoidea]